MRSIAVVLIFASVLVSQTKPIRVSPDMAQSHFLKGQAPEYPHLAEMARIQGIVEFEIGIDEEGRTSITKLIHGHPMLAQAASNAVKSWRYRPFEVNGKPVPVSTLVMVAFGRTLNSDDRVHLKLDDNFEVVQSAIASGDYADAERRLAEAKQLLGSASAGNGFEHDRWQLHMTWGQLLAEEQKRDEAEQSYREAVAVYSGSSKPELWLAQALQKLGTLQLDQKEYEGAQKNLAQSADVYEAICRDASCVSALRKQNNQEAAAEYWQLSSMAIQQKKPKEAATWCKKVLDKRKALDDNNRDSIVATCESAVNTAK